MTSPAFRASRRDKILFPGDGLTKGDLIDYYARIAPHMLPHLRDRPLTLRRFPDGIGETGFFQKAAGEHYPDWIPRATVAKAGGTVTHPLCADRDDLRYLADQAAIELHVWLARLDRPHHPDRLVFDLDPPGDDFAPVVHAARALRSHLDDLGLAAFVMTTGSRGLHVTLPLDRGADCDRVRAFAHGLAARMADESPDAFTVAQRKAERGDRVYLDVMRNAYAQTGVAPYSVRAKPGAPVATPLAWRELDDPRLHPRRYHLRNIFRRLGQRDCPWRDIDRHAQSLDAAMRGLGIGREPG